jgi:EmrB/QacA subfamily drug resistance transporter
MTLDTSITRPRGTSAGPGGARKWLPLAVTLTGIFMIVLDFFIVNVAIPSIQRDLHADPAAIEWVVSAYGLCYGTGLITGGRLGDLYGRRRVFLLGLAAFTAASVACGVAGGTGVLIASRAMQGLAASLAGPQVLALIGACYAGRERARAVVAYGVTMGVAAVFGQLIGGALIQADVAGLGWRSCFLVNVPIGLAALIFTPRLVPESGGGSGARLDPAGTVLVTAALVAIILPLVDGRQQGWPPWSWLCLGCSVPLLAAFAVHQALRRSQGRTPLIDLALFADRALSTGLIAIVVFTCAMASFFVVLALYLQEGRGLSAIGSGAVFTAVGAGYLATSLAPQRIIARFGRQWPALGGVVMAAGYLTLRFAVTSAGGHTAALVPALLVTGLGMGMLMAPLMTIVLAGVQRQAGAASGLLNTAVQVGNSVGVAVIGVVFFGAVAGGFAHAFAASLGWLAASPLAVTVLVQLLPRRSPGPSR